MKKGAKTMANDLNCVTLVGRITGDIKSDYVGENQKVEFSIANNFYKKSDPKAVNFFNCVLWGRQCKFLLDYAKKGSQVAILGEARQDRWEDKNGGGKRSKVYILVKDIQLVGSKNESDYTPAQSQATEPIQNELPSPPVEPAPDASDLTDEDDVPY